MHVLKFIKKEVKGKKKSSHFHDLLVASATYYNTPIFTSLIKIDN